MEVSNDMMQAAMKKAVEAGLLPRHASREEARINLDLIRIVLQAAVDTVPRNAPSARRAARSQCHLRRS